MELPNQPADKERSKNLLADKKDVKPITTEQQRTKVENIDFRPSCVNASVSSGPSIEHSPTNAPKQSLNCFKTVPGYIQKLRNDNNCYHAKKLNEMIGFAPRQGCC